MAFTNCRRPLDTRSAQFVLEVRFELLELLSLACEFIGLDHAYSPLANVVRASTLQPTLGAPPQQPTATESEPKPSTPRVEFQRCRNSLSSRAEPGDFCAKYGGHRVHFMANFMP
jgi:hypothetical protein